MHTSKKIIALLLLLLSQQYTIIAQQNSIPESFTNDPRVLGVIFMGIAIGGIGLSFLVKGLIRVVNGREKGEVNGQENTLNEFIAETWARLGGAGTTLVGLITTGCGVGAIIGAKEIIFKCDQLMKK